MISENIIKKLRLRLPASEDSIEEAEEHFSISFPEDFKEFLRKSNGAEGFIGNDTYVLLYPIEEIIPVDKVYFPDPSDRIWIVFGSDGSDTAFAFDVRTKNLDVVLMSMIIRKPKKCACSFSELLDMLSKDEIECI